VFVDTGGWYAVVSQDDRHHAAATRYHQQQIQNGARLLTSDYILDETLTRLRYDFGHAVAVTFYRQIMQALEQGLLTLLRVDEPTWTAAVELFQQYADQRFSFTDCTSFVLAQTHRADEVFGFDQHFLMFGLPLRPTE